MPNDRFDGLSYQRFSDFYRQEYGEFLSRYSALSGNVGSVFEARQSAGDFSTTATTDHVFVQTLHTPCSVTADLGAGRRRQFVAVDSIGFSPAGVPAEFVVDDDHSVRIFAVPAALAASICDVDLVHALEPLDGRFSNSRLMADVFQALSAIACEGDSASTLMVDSIVATFLSGMIHFAGNAKAAKPTGRLADWQARRACAMINDHLSKEVTLAEIANEVGLSQFHFCRTFKMTTGLAPHQYQVARRVERAKDLLCQPRWSITQIAALVGYDDPNQLARVFRKATGVSPSEYRRSRDR